MFVQTPGEAEAGGEVAAYLQRQRQAWGFVPNYASCFTTRPDVAQAWDALVGAVRGGMDRRRYELVTVAAARARRSTYCTAAHSTFLRDACDDEATLRALAEDPTGATLDEADRAVYAFAGKVARDAAAVEPDDVDALRAVGLSDADVADVVMAVAARLFFTTVLDGLGARLDAQTAGAIDPALLAGMVVGRPPAES